MTRHIVLVAVSAAVASLCFASTAAAQSPAPTAALPTLRADSRIVIIDIGVTDAQGNAVKNLTAADFTLNESGKPQTISHFEAHTSLAPADAVKLPLLPKLEPNIFTNYSPTPEAGALNVLLLDALNTPMKDQSAVRQEMLKYLNTPHPGTRMAVFGLTTQLHLLQGFTSDPEVLRAALSKSGPRASVAMDNAMSGDQPGAETMADTLNEQLGNDPSMAVVIAGVQQMQAEQQSYQLQLRTRFTLDAMNDLARYLSGLPGRKNLIWFSGSFPINIMPDGDLIDPFAIMADYSNEFRETTSLLARSQVAVYPIDARGLMTEPMLQAQNSGQKYGSNPKALLKDRQTFYTQTASEHATMQEMAEDTGGKAFVNTNGLAEAVQKAVDAGSNFYTLVYTPTNRDWKGEFRRVQVQLAKSGYKLTYRHGYYADNPDASQKNEAKADAPLLIAPKPGPTANNTVGGSDPDRIAMRSAMLYGGPDPIEILFKAAINPLTGMQEATVAKGNFPDAKLNGPFKNYVVYVAAVPTEFTFTSMTPGKHHLAAEMSTVVYNADGVQVNSTSLKVDREIDEAPYHAILKSGLQFRQMISVPVKGQYFLRIGVHDLVSDRVGAIEVPAATVEKLKPLMAPVAVKLGKPDVPATPAPPSAPPPPPQYSPAVPNNHA